MEEVLEVMYEEEGAKEGESRVETDTLGVLVSDVLVD